MGDVERMEDVQPEIEPEIAEPGSAEPEEPTQEAWRAALEQAVQQRDAYLDMTQRSQAEFANYRKRNESARAESYDEGIREALTQMLPFLDNLERAIGAAEAAGEKGALLEGVEMTRKMALEAAGKLGLEEIPALGQPFDPELHNAVLRADEGEPGTVLEVYQKGYRVRGRIIRYPMVKVAAE